jgi:ribonuclease P protein component
VHRKFRLTRSDDFKRVRRNGKSYAHPLVVLTAQPNEHAELHIGFAAGRALGNAVKRNRARRMLREAMRRLLPSLASGWDMVLIARPKLASASLEEIRAALVDLLQRAGIFPVNES